jgi:hypothetical protein
MLWQTFTQHKKVLVYLSRILYPLDKKLGGPQRRSGRYGVEKKSLPPAGNGIPSTQLVALRYTD